jgi:integration host factor subunit alpha
VRGRAAVTKSINRDDLCEVIHRQIGFSRPVSARLVEQVLEEITACLERGETVKLSSFGSFVVRRKGPRMGRNLRTGRDVPITSRRVVAFKPSPILKQRINLPPEANEQSN